MINLNKKRSNFGRWVDKQLDLKRSELEKASCLSPSTVLKICNNQNYRPRFATVSKMNQGLKKLGKDIDLNDFYS